MCESSEWADTGQVKRSLMMIMMMMKFNDALLNSIDRRMFWCFFPP